jgi:hypothetical protein
LFVTDGGDKYAGPYLQHFILFSTRKMAGQASVILQFEMLASYKHPSLFEPCERYENDANCIGKTSFVTDGRNK